MIRLVRGGRRGDRRAAELAQAGARTVTQDFWPAGGDIGGSPDGSDALRSEAV